MGTLFDQDRRDYRLINNEQRDEQLCVLQAFGIDAQDYDRTKAMLGSHGFAGWA